MTALIHHILLMLSAKSTLLPKKPPKTGLFAQNLRSVESKVQKIFLQKKFLIPEGGYLTPPDTH
ncbi:hypothetical protein [Bdellovibrio sp. ArHS]|uniref:hypothetical protein n=1 Tax=Bdellovibrio sp. ArHS TaxID=1569284 RepID=UPI0025BF2AAA|nr:hypothetical protein [Bdellovibrio sp. ArHS]